MSSQGSVNNGAPSSALAVSSAGMSVFAKYLKDHEAAISKVCASFMKPDRITRIVLGCVAQTPALKNCTMGSILTSVVKAAELGLEPGSALGEAYLVPFKSTCQMIPGYRGLIALAYRSGQVKSVQSKEVYEGDEFEFELGLNPKLRHVPTGDANSDPEKITHAYCVIQLKEGGIIYDTMTRKEIDSIRGRSKASSNGPWVTDYAEMAKKTVTRRALKYAPMSIEMSKAFAADVEVDTGESSNAEFDSLDVLEGEFTTEQGQQEDTRTTGVEAVKKKVGISSNQPPPPPEEPTTTEPGEEIRAGLFVKAGNLLNELYTAEALRNATIKKYLKDTPFDKASVDQLNVLIEALEDLKSKKK